VGHYKILDADTLETKSEGTDGEGSPAFVGISETGALGFGAGKHFALKDGQDFFVRVFGEPWREFPAQVDVSFHLTVSLQLENFTFLNNDAILLLNKDKERPEPPLRVVHIDGTTASLPSIPRLPENTWLDGPVMACDQGRYFVAGFKHRPWLSHLMLDVMTMDMAFTDDQGVLVVWRASDLVPVASISTGVRAEMISCSPNGPMRIAWLNGKKLEVTGLPSRE
jgi:hypothetical protein